MTSRNSSTSNFNGARYLAAFAFACVCTILLIMGGSFIAIRYNLIQWHFGELLDYQISKLNAAGDIDILLVGDSSLGNAVDARQWSRELDKNAVSVALTGAYGLSGSLNMIRRATRQHKVSAIILMQAADTMVRAPSRQGDLYTAERLADMGSLGPRDIVPSLANWDILSRTIAAGVKSNNLSEIRRVDYFPQTKPLSTTLSKAPEVSFNAAAIQPEHFQVVREIAAECKRLAIACLYVVGPIVSSACESSREYFKQVFDHVEAAGLRVIRENVCMPWRDVGDSMDHVIPERKESYSARILDLVKPALELVQK